MMILTIDASVAVKWIVEEPGSDQACAYLPIKTGNTIHVAYILLAPSLIALEVHNTIAKKYRNKTATFEQLAESDLAARYIDRLEPLDQDLIDTAREMSLVARHRLAHRKGAPRPDLGAVFNIYDCIYVAHAKRHQTALLTADHEQAEVAREFGVPVEWVATA